MLASLRRTPHAAKREARAATIDRVESLGSRRASAGESPRGDLHRLLETRDFRGQGPSAGGRDLEPSLPCAVVDGVGWRALESANESLLDELVECAVERHRPELELSLRELEDVPHDRRAMAIAFSEREKDVKPV